MEMSELLRKIGSEYSLWKRFKKMKQYYKAKEFLGRCEMLIELYLSLGGKEEDSNALSMIIKEVRGF